MASFVFALDNAAGATASDTTVATTLASVASSDLIAMQVVWLHASATASVSDGTNTASAATALRNTNNTSAQWHYFLPGSHVTGSVTLTATFTAGSTNRSIMAFRITTTGTVTLDQQNITEGSTTSAVSGNITTTGATSIAFGGVTDDNLSTAPSSMQINGIGATANTHGPVNNSFNSWFLVVASTFTGQASATVDPGAHPLCSIINFITVDVATNILFAQSIF